MKQIFESVKLKELDCKNRLVRSATWEELADENGGINDQTYAIYDQLAKGGIGAIITGFTSVSLHDYYFDGMMRLCDDSLIDQYKHLTELIHKEHVPVISQLALGAYYKEINGRYKQIEPDYMTEHEIHDVIQHFIDAAVRAKKAGFDGVQIHAAHFFFLSRFISPAVNHRTDQYGGSIENRARILLEILSGIKEAVPDLHISTKINSSDFIRGGIDEKECLTICRLLDTTGIDSIEISGNGTSVSGIKPHINEGYFVHCAANVAENVSCPVIVVGGFRSLDTMEHVLNASKIQFISLSRPLLCEPDFPNKLLQNPSALSKCISCNACYRSPAHKCIFRKKDLS